MHGLQPLLRLLRLARPSQSINQSVVRSQRRCNTAGMHLLHPFFRARDLAIARQSIDNNPIGRRISLHPVRAHALDPLLCLTGIASSRTALNNQVKRRGGRRQTGRQKTLHVTRGSASIASLQTRVQKSLIRGNVRVHASSFDGSQPSLGTGQTPGFCTGNNGCIVSRHIDLKSKLNDRLNASLDTISVALPAQSHEHRIHSCHINLDGAANSPGQPTLRCLQPASLHESDYDLHRQASVHHTALVHHLLQKIDSPVEVFVLHRNLNHRCQRPWLARNRFTLLRLRALRRLTIGSTFDHAAQQRYSDNHRAQRHAAQSQHEAINARLDDQRGNTDSSAHGKILSVHRMAWILDHSHEHDPAENTRPSVPGHPVGRGSISTLCRSCCALVDRPGRRGITHGCWLHLSLSHPFRQRIHRCQVHSSPTNDRNRARNPYHGHRQLGQQHRNHVSSDRNSEVIVCTKLSTLICVARLFRKKLCRGCFARGTQARPSY
mmetsp:Transcript_59279/g.129819  ORF Transcript_59279/g.129819 Transcript_59279/m.129819 type:complete len:492 (-) Transcript_59279:15-1490(-)